MSAQQVHTSLQAALAVCEEHAEELGELDAIAGDGDHGFGMVRGLRAASSATATFEGTTGEAVAAAGDAFAEAAGGASGAIWGVLLRAIGERLDTADESEEAVAVALRAGQDEVSRVGKAKVGDKTLLDTLDPFVTQLQTSLEAGGSLTDAWSDALDTAQGATQRTAKMVSRRGRSAVLGERSLGSIDPGARSLLLILQRVAATIPEDRHGATR